jgi:competence protein ComGC
MKKNNKSGYTLLEFLLFFGLLVGVGFLTVPQIFELRANTKDRNQQVVVSKLESAKNSYDSTANEQARNRFDGSSDEARFELLAPLMGAEDPVSFVRGSGISRLRINRLGENVEIE